MSERERIGEILVKKGYISAEEMEEGLVNQDKTGIRLGECLVRSGRISRDQLVDALARQFNMVVIEPTAEMIDDETWQMLPSAWMAEHGIVPLYHDGETLEVVTSDPQNVDLVETIREITGLETHFNLADAESLDKIIQKKIKKKKRRVDSPAPAPLEQPIQERAHNIIALSSVQSPVMIYDGIRGWERITGHPSDLIAELTSRCGLSDDYHGAVWLHLPILESSSFAAARGIFLKTADGTRVDLRLEYQTDEGDPIIPYDWLRTSSFPLRVIAAENPWLPPIMSSTIPEHPIERLTSIVIAPPGWPTPPGVTHLPINGVSPEQTCEALAAACALPCRSIILDCPIPSISGLLPAITAATHRGVTVTIIWNQDGPYGFMDAFARECHNQPDITGIPDVRMTTLLPMLSENEVAEQSDSAMIRYECLVFKNGKWMTETGETYPGPGTATDAFPPGTIPYACSQMEPSRIDFDDYAVQKGWRLKSVFRR